MTRDQQRIKQLETRAENQQKVLKLTLQDRRTRQASNPRAPATADILQLCVLSFHLS